MILITVNDVFHLHRGERSPISIPGAEPRHRRRSSTARPAAVRGPTTQSSSAAGGQMQSGEGGAPRQAGHSSRTREGHARERTGRAPMISLATVGNGFSRGEGRYRHPEAQHVADEADHEEHHERRELRRRLSNLQGSTHRLTPSDTSMQASDERPSRDAP